MQFGHTRKPAAKPAGVRYLTVKDLPEKGLQYSTSHLSPRKLAWAESVIDSWIASKTEAA
jgi:hypothetical protein